MTQLDGLLIACLQRCRTAAPSTWCSASDDERVSVKAVWLYWWCMNPSYDSQLHSRYHINKLLHLPSWLLSSSIFSPQALHLLAAPHYWLSTYGCPAFLRPARWSGQLAKPRHWQGQLQLLFKDVFKISLHLVVLECYDSVLYKL